MYFLICLNLFYTYTHTHKLSIKLQITLKNGLQIISFLTHAWNCLYFDPILFFCFVRKKTNSPKLPRGEDQPCDAITYILQPLSPLVNPFIHRSFPNGKNAGGGDGGAYPRSDTVLSVPADTGGMSVKGRSGISAHGKLVEVEVAKDVLSERIELSCSSFKFV